VEAKDGKGEYYVWIFTVRVTHPSGHFKTSTGACSSRDKFFSAKGKTPDEANIIAKAETSAFNRAILDLLGAPKLTPEEAY